MGTYSKKLYHDISHLTADLLMTFKIFPIIHLDHPAMMTRYGCGVVRAQA